MTVKNFITRSLETTRQGVDRQHFLQNVTDGLFLDILSITRQPSRVSIVPHMSLSGQSTVTRIFNMKKELAKERPKLTDERAKKRLEWAKEHQHWIAEDSRKVIWSDECSIEKSATRTQTWVWRLPSEKWDKDCIAPKKKGNGTSLMVWGYFGGNQRGTLVPLVVHSVVSFVYRRLCKFLVLPVGKSPWN